MFFPFNRHFLRRFWEDWFLLSSLKSPLFGGKWILVYVWLNSFAVHQRLSQHHSSAILQDKIKKKLIKSLWCASILPLVHQSLPGSASAQLCGSLLNFVVFSSLPTEKETASHSSVLAWRIPGTGEPGGLPSIGSHSRTQLKRHSSSSSSSSQSVFQAEWSETRLASGLGISWRKSGLWTKSTFKRVRLFFYWLLL